MERDAHLMWGNSLPAQRSSLKTLTLQYRVIASSNCLRHLPIRPTQRIKEPPTPLSLFSTNPYQRIPTHQLCFHKHFYRLFIIPPSLSVPIQQTLPLRIHLRSTPTPLISNQQELSAKLLPSIELQHHLLSRVCGRFAKAVHTQHSHTFLHRLQHPLWYRPVLFLLY